MSSSQGSMSIHSSELHTPSPAVLQNCQMRNCTLNVGVGAGVLYMLITCQKEMEKINKMVGETESLVQELKQQLESNPDETGSHHAQSFDNTCCPSQSSHACIEHPVSAKASKVDNFLDGRVSLTPGIAKDQMVVLAAELEAELELMELNIKSEESGPFEACIHDGDEVLFKGISHSYYSDTSSHGMLETSDVGRPSAQSEASCINFGVSAIDLDHRLRELLEAQQQKHILELEELLEETKAKFLVKEHEILCWKNHVNSLTSLLQPHPNAGEAYVHRPNNLNIKETATLYDKFVLEVTKNGDLFESFQDSLISMQACDADMPVPTDVLKDACIQKTASSHRSSDSNLLNAKHIPNKGSILAPGKTSYPMVAAGESNCLRDFEETGIDTPEYAIMKEMDTHIAGENPEVREEQICSSLVDKDIDDTCVTPEISRLQHLKCKVDVSGGHAYDSETVLAKTVANIPECHPANCRMDINESSVFSKEELDQDSDVKYVVNMVMRRPLLLDKYHENPVKEATQLPKLRIPFINENLKTITKKCLQETLEISVGVTSPVLDKIRHYESLGARVSNKRV